MMVFSPKLIAEYSKEGAGEFRLRIFEGAYGKDGITSASTSCNGELISFNSTRDCYDYFRHRTENNNSCWNICYHLEDHIN
jgi:hypothetical protein